MSPSSTPDPRERNRRVLVTAAIALTAIVVYRVVVALIVLCKRHTSTRSKDGVRLNKLNSSASASDYSRCTCRAARGSRLARCTLASQSRLDAMRHSAEASRGIGQHSKRALPCCFKTHTHRYMYMPIHTRTHRAADDASLSRNAPCISRVRPLFSGMMTRETMTQLPDTCRSLLRAARE